LNSDSNLEKAAAVTPAVTNGEVAVTNGEVGDSNDPDGDSNDPAAVTANPLNNKDGDGSDASDGIFPNSAGGGAEAGVYELGPAPPGERCFRCGKAGGVNRIKHGGGVDLLHDGCVEPYLAAQADPPVKVPDLGPDTLDEHGEPLAASVPFMITQAQKRLLRAYGYSDEDITHLTPQQAREILADEHGELREAASRDNEG
jgi:hypothetical protein